MRVDKIRGKKHCTYCGKAFGYSNIRKTFCSNICSMKYRRANEKLSRDRPISLGFIPKHLIEEEQS
tara:strand:- start:3206 stop:3403 length:198 start_codon:yes stop_codon:yes gene_type:complete